MEGVPLSPFRPGSIYNVPNTLGHQLIAMNAAVQVRANDSAANNTDVEHVTGGVRVVPKTDRPKKPRKKKLR